MSQEAACAALFALVSNAYAWGSTPSRRLKLWDQVGTDMRPALFQFEGGQDTYKWGTGLNVSRTVAVKLFIYLNASDDNPGAPQINTILDAINAALQPTQRDEMLGRLTSGGTAFMMRIKGVPLKDPGDIDGVGLLIVEIEITLP